jgi:hypothetical protein
MLKRQLCPNMLVATVTVDGAQSVPTVAYCAMFCQTLYLHGLFFGKVSEQW